jgi:hypothetical protein
MKEVEEYLISGLGGITVELRKIAEILSRLEASARTRRGRVRSEPLEGGSAPPGKAKDCVASPAEGGAKKSEACPRCKGTGKDKPTYSGEIKRCFKCKGTGSLVAPPSPTCEPRAAE